MNKVAEVLKEQINMMTLNKIDRLVFQVEREEYTLKPDDEVVKVMQWYYSKLFERKCSIQETIDYLTASINQYSINYSLDILSAMELWDDEESEK